MIRRVLLLTGILGSLAAAETIRGKLFHINPAKRSFDLLKETEYDPQTRESAARITCRWTKDARITKIEQVQSFAGIKGPIWATLKGIDQRNQQAVEAGKPFVVRVATLVDLPPGNVKSRVAKNEVAGWFTPDSDDGTNAGSIRLNGTGIPVQLRKNHWQIWHHSQLAVEDLASGFWRAELSATEQEGTLVVDRIDATSLPDPRETDDPRLPRVLVIGDSISMNYHDAAKKALRGIANYHRIEGNGGNSGRGVANTPLWLGDFTERGLHWDVIQFNHGLHDLKQAYDQANDTWGDYAVGLDDYKANLEKEIALLRKTGARLIWCTTTPVPNSRPGPYARRKGASAIFNAAAMEVMSQHPDILVNDLHGLIDGSAEFDGWREGNDVHFYKERERKLLGGAVADSVKNALQPKPKLQSLNAVSFNIAGSEAFLIVPPKDKLKTPLPWVWYAPTLPKLPGKEEEWMFRQLLDEGIAIAGIDVGESMGNPAGRAKFDSFYRDVTKSKSCAKKPCLLARSRGGLMLYNWAVENPECVGGIAGIYPVGNLASWPGLKRAAPAYCLSDEQLAERLAEHNPVDRLAPLAKARVPLFHLHGDSDRVVPLETNSGLLQKRYAELGGTMTLKVIPGGGHDMKEHWFRNQELVDFIVEVLEDAD